MPRHRRFPAWSGWIRLLALAAWVMAVGGLLPPVHAGPRVVLNEWVSSNGSTLADEDGDSPDWIELGNLGDAPAELAGWGLSDNPGRPFKWVFRPVTLPPGGFLVVFASGKDRQPAPVTALDPAAVPGLLAHLSAAVIARDDSGQVRRAGSDAYVREWRSLSAGGLSASQPDPARQPRLVTDPDGRPALSFDGADDRLLFPRVPASNQFTLVAVFRPRVGHQVDPVASSGAAGVEGQRWLFGPGHGGETGAGAGISAGTNGVSLYEHGAGYLPARAVFAGAIGSSWSVVTLTYSNRTPTLSVQGTVVGRGGTSPRDPVQAPTELGGGAYGSFFGEVAEIVLFNRALGPEERLGIETWLAGRRAIPLWEPRHANFSLSADGESLLLTAPDGLAVDRADFGPIPRDVSLGRPADGRASWVFFAQPTPGAPNTTAPAAEVVGPVEFSVAGGFFTNTVRLTLSSSTSGAVIHYTLDGSEPDGDSPDYGGPLVLGNREGTPNALSLIPTAGSWQAPSGEVFKGWVIRARAFKPGALSAPSVTHSYFISPAGRSRYSVPVVSLTTDRRYFFDPAVGIYVPGNTGANFSQRGPEWEHPLHLEFFETNGVRVLAQEALVSIHGNTSQGFPIKGLDLDATGGAGRAPFRHRIFPDRPRESFGNVLLRPSGHDHYLAFMRDELMQSLMAETGAESQAARLCVVFLNGEYWGLHYLKEKQDTEFVSHYANRSRDAIDYLEGYAAARAGDTAAWDALVRLLADHDPADPAVYAAAQERMEVPSYIDYKAAEIFTYRWDIGNHRFWRPRTPDGRFRWLQFDNDVGWGGFWAVQPAWEFDMLQADLDTSGSLNGHNNETTTFLLRRLVLNPEFRRDFINRACDLLNTVHEPGQAIGRIDRFARVLEPEMDEHIRRWRFPASLDAWRANVAYLRDFARQRPGQVRQHFRRRFGLGPDVRLGMATSPAEGGTVRVNRVTVPAGGGTVWTGTYFRDHPLPVTAEPAPGYRLAAWDGLFGVTQTNLLLRLTGDLRLTARFEPVPLTLQARLAAGTVEITVQGAPGTPCVVQRGATPGSWADAGSLTLDASGRARWQAPPDGSAQFFRVLLNP